MHRRGLAENNTESKRKVEIHRNYNTGRKMPMRIFKQEIHDDIIVIAEYARQK